MARTRTVSVAPDHLDAYVGTGAGLDDALLAAASRLEVLAARCAVVAPAEARVLAEVAAGLRRVRADEQELGGWMARLARRVRAVDARDLRRRFVVNRSRLVHAAWGEGDHARFRAMWQLLDHDPETHRNRQFLDVRADGDGQITEVFGDLVTARHVLLFVPGSSSYLQNFDRAVASRGRRLYDLARRLTRQGVAVVCWLGYDPPDLDHPSWHNWLQVARQRTARHGGAALDRFIAGLPLRAEQDITLIGHSYGSTTVGAALLDPAAPPDGPDPLGRADIDKVIVVGSPGVLVSHASRFHRPHTDFFVEAARGDPVARIPRFGLPPQGPFTGFTRLTTSGRGHGAYFLPGSVGERNIAEVVVGGRPEQMRWQPPVLPPPSTGLLLPRVPVVPVRWR